MFSISSVAFSHFIIFFFSFAVYFISKKTGCRSNQNRPLGVCPSKLNIAIAIPLVLFDLCVRDVGLWFICFTNINKALFSVYVSVCVRLCAELHFYRRFSRFTVIKLLRAIYDGLFAVNAANTLRFQKKICGTFDRQKHHIQNKVNLIVFFLLCIVFSIENRKLQMTLVTRLL